MRRVLVAGLGNVFFGDDGFGVEVVQRLARESLPDDVAVLEVGIRTTHLALELLDAPALLVLVDAAARGGAPGTLYVIDPEEELSARRPVIPDAHAANPFAVLATLSWVGGRLPRTILVACEPGDLSGPMCLSGPVEAAIAPAMDIVRELIDSEVGEVEA